METINLGPDEAVVAGRIYGDLERTGQPIGRADPMIAGIAVVHGVVLATGNVDHNERIQALGYELTIDNWRDNPMRASLSKRPRSAASSSRAVL